MPYKTVKQDCTRSDGKKGKYVLKYKPKKPTSKKKDSQGFVKAGCHTSKEKAAGQRAAIEGGPRWMGETTADDQVLDWLLETIEELDEKEDHNEDGENDFEDVKIARMKASGMSDAEIKKKYPDLFESDTPHLASYNAPQGSKRDKQLDQTKADLKKAKELRKKGESAKAKELEQRAYNRRDRMEKKAREKNESIIREAVRKILLEELSKATEDKIRKKAESRGYTFGSMKAEYKKGLAAFASSGSRPGMTAHGWAMARINKCTESDSWSNCKKSKAKKKK
mgnify:CR=1 FL=1